MKKRQYIDKISESLSRALIDGKIFKRCALAGSLYNIVNHLSPREMNII